MRANKLFNSKLVHLCVIALSLFLIFTTTVNATTYNMIWDTSINFGLTTYDTYIAWDKSIYLNQFTFNNGENITFTELYVDADISEITLGTATSNITVTQLDANYFSYTVDGSGNQTIEYGTKTPTTVTIDGIKLVEGSGWTQTDYITLITSATASVTLYYATEYTGTNTTGFTNPLFQYILEGDYLYFVVACYTTVMGQAFFGLVAFFVSAVVYLKTKSLYLVGFLYILFGPTYLALVREFSFLAALFTVVGVVSVLAEFVTAWRNR
jgi:hypothetical protein